MRIGGAIAYLLATPDWERNGSQLDLWLVPKGAEPQPLAEAPPVDSTTARPQAAPATPQPKGSYAPAPPRKTARTYVVRKGDTLQKISKKFYGTTKKWRRIYKANRKTLSKGPDKLQPGMKLVIP